MSTKKSTRTLPVTTQAAIRHTPAPKAQAVKTEIVHYKDPEALAYAQFVQDMQAWLSLENFREQRAVGLDWSMLQYWLYFTDDLIAVHDFETKDIRSELSLQVQDAIESLYAAGRCYEQSGRELMYLTPEERDGIRAALMIRDQLKAMCSDKLLLSIDKHVRKVMSVPQGR